MPIVIGVCALCTTPVSGDINLEFRAVADVVAPGEIVEIGLYAVSDDASLQSFSAMEVIFDWDPTYLQFIGIDDTGAVALQSSFLPYPDGTGLNEADPPQDGDGLYIAWAKPGLPVDATPDGVLITTFQYEAQEVTAGTDVGIAEEWTGESGTFYTFVVDGEIPGLHVEGLLIGTSIAVLLPCAADITGSEGIPDGVVDVLDLLAVLSQWGLSGTADITGPDEIPDGIVDVLDLIAVLAAWGPCP